MKGRPSIYYDKELILNIQKIFWEKGFSGTSLSDLSNATGAGAGSLYNKFKGGKKELFLKALEQRREDFNLFKQKIEASTEPIDLIKRFFLGISKSDKQTHLRGCIVANTLVEMTFIDEDLENEAIKILKETELLFAQTIEKEQRKGNLKTKVKAQILARYLITFWCGINSLRRIYPNQQILKEQIELQLTIIN
ncbi:TetR/AcrR family transcriptional regulator [Avrilella dinanensis]|uniref:TetR family transcriptional regulator n=1 Tax=Avrilella dinanensis TaxID=2008672 RepID=A0A2M9R5L5_9FLAO|nr:TetR/AcrR family transcriptional regulator [Avrilella dinanensis]PJR04045.1 TetR family transcriptional regulator [Avrilella dinanensis]